jgi:hypothetical protein
LLNSIRQGRSGGTRLIHKGFRYILGFSGGYNPELALRSAAGSNSRLARYLLIRTIELSPQPLVAYCVFCSHLPFGL